MLGTGAEGRRLPGGPGSGRGMFFLPLVGGLFLKSCPCPALSPHEGLTTSWDSGLTADTPRSGSSTSLPWTFISASPGPTACMDWFLSAPHLPALQFSEYASDPCPEKFGRQLENNDINQRWPLKGML